MLHAKIDLARYALVELPVALVHVDLTLAADAEARDAVHCNRQLPPDGLLRLRFRHNLGRMMDYFKLM